jgi:hypothetical protein
MTLDQLIDRLISARNMGHGVLPVYHRNDEIMDIKLIVYSAVRGEGSESYKIEIITE